MNYKSCLIYLWYLSLAASLNYVPKSRQIDVLDNGEYTFGFVQDDASTHITKITYSSDTGIAGEFPVVKSSKSINGKDHDSIKENRNQVTDNGKIGLCTMNVRRVSDTGPKLWTLTPYQEGNDLNPVTFKVNFFYKAPPLVETVDVVEGSSFLQYVTLSDKQWTKCFLQFEDVQIDLNLDSALTYMFILNFSEGAEDIAKKVKSLGRRLCGFHLTNSTLAMNNIKQWSLTAIDNLGGSYRSIFRVVVRERSNSNLKKEVLVGDRTYWSCGTKSSAQSYCALYNPAGKLMQDGNDCGYNSETVLITDIGKWTCITGVRNSMETQDYTIDVVNKGIEEVETWVNEDSKYVKLGCKLKNPTYKNLNFCRMVTPNNKVLNIFEGGATGRYASLGTNLGEGTCALEIEKPLEIYENGLWRCELSAVSPDITGGFLKVGDVKRPDYPKYIRVSTQLKETFTILCEVPYSSEYCHIRAPNGTIYQTDSEYRTRLGHCSYTVVEASVTDNGKWFCSFAREMGTPDEEITVEVIIAEVLVYYSVIEVRSGDNAQLMCSSGGLPLKYCRFISPSGKAYHIHNHQTSKTMSYNGKGLEYGECGISINPVQTLDNGIWTCVTRIGANYRQPEITARISLVVSPNYFEDPNIAAAVGLSVGIVVVSTVTGLIVFRRWRQRRNRQANSPQTRLINDGDNVTLSFSDPTDPTQLSNVQDSHVHQQ